jgi:hypothetical protein
LGLDGSSSHVFIGKYSPRSQKAGEESTIDSVINTLANQGRQLTLGFSDSNLPWKGSQAQSVWSGCSGVFYLLPCLYLDTTLERWLWSLQALFSVLADYFCAGFSSPMHGIDRWWATTMTIYSIFTVIKDIGPMAGFIAVPPLLCFVIANRAKRMKQLNFWIASHFMWHLVGGLACAYAMKLCQLKRQAMAIGSATE